MAIIKAIVAGERDPRRLAQLRDGRCHKSEGSPPGFSSRDRHGIRNACRGAISTVLRNNLSSLRPADPLAYFMAIAMFVFVIALAVSVPARRAVRIQPAEALRHE
jgi:hypothetical protein